LLPVFGFRTRNNAALVKQRHTRCRAGGRSAYPDGMDLTAGTVRIRTGVAGSAARMGHRLVIAVDDWSATVDLRRGEPTAVRFRASLRSLRVESGRGGVTPLTPVDKQVIVRNAAKVLNSADHPEVTFVSSEVTAVAGGYEVSGELTIRAATRSLTTTVEVADGRAGASIPVLQTDFCIKPYSLMLGQLKVEDEVSVDLDIELAP